MIDIRVLLSVNRRQVLFIEPFIKQQVNITMKKTLLIASFAAIASSVLCNCAGKSSHAPAQITAQPAQINANLAPQNVKGKLIVFNHANATTRKKNEATGSWSGWTRSQEGTLNWDYFKDLSDTHIDAKGRTAVRGFEGDDYVFYTKTSGSTAEVRLNGSDGSSEIYVLKFTTPTSGIATQISTDEEGALYSETNNISFTIK